MLYHIDYAGDEEFVEAESLTDALAIWKQKLADDLGPNDYDDEEEPDSITLVSQRPVLRRGQLFELQS